MVAVTKGSNIMELITRARTHLSVILVGKYQYAKTMRYFQQAADLGLVEMVQLSENAVEMTQVGDDILDEADEEIEERVNDDAVNKSNEEFVEKSQE